jgi:hypothetical protein
MQSLYLFNFQLIHEFGIVRLKDCVDLLESMEQKGLLDMKKVINYLL